MQIQDSNTHTGVQESRTSGQQYKYRTAIQIQKSKSPRLQESRLGDIAPRRNAGDRTEGSTRGLARVFARCLCLESMSPGLQECRTPRVLDGSVARAIYHQHACVNTHLYSKSADTEFVLVTSIRRSRTHSTVSSINLGIKSGGRFAIIPGQSLRVRGHLIAERTIVAIHRIQTRAARHLMPCRAARV